MTECELCLSDITLHDASGSTYWHKKDSEKAKFFQKRVLFNISKCNSYKKTRLKHTNEGRGGIVRIESAAKKTV